MPSEHAKFMEVGFKDLSQDADAFWNLEHHWFSYAAHQGSRDYMEDRMHCLVDPGSHFSAFSIFDGHGGDYVADYLEKHYSANIRDRILNSGGSPGDEDESHRVKRAIKSTIHAIDEHISHKDPSKTADSGSTLCSAILLKNKYLNIVNIGDSRAVACDSQGRCIPLTKDHKPTDPKEKHRIEDAGGVVLKYQNDVERVQGILAMSRSIGDASLKPNDVVTAEPDIRCFDLSQTQFRYLVLASDGLFDVIDSQEVIQYINTFLKNHGTKEFSKISHLLCKEALRRQTLDNVSCMVIKLVM